MKKGFLAALGLTVALGFGVAQGDPNAQPTPPDSEAQQSAGLSHADFVTSLRSNSDLSTFADLFERSGLATELFEGGPVTIIAPSNEAFTAAGVDINSLTDQEVEALVRNHVVSGDLQQDQLSSLTALQTLHGGEYALQSSGDAMAGGQMEGEVAGGGAADEPEGEPAQDSAAEPGAAGAAAADAGFTLDGAQLTPAEGDFAGVTVYEIDTVLLPADFEQGVSGGGAGEGAEDPMDTDPVEAPQAPIEEPEDSDPVEFPAAPVDGEEDGAGDGAGQEAPGAPGQDDADQQEGPGGVDQPDTQEQDDDSMTDPVEEDGGEDQL